MKLFVFGIDALDPKILFGYLDEFPNFKRLVEQGASGILEGYCYGYGSYDNWASVYTGLSPQKHGIIGSGASKGAVPSIEHIREHRCLWDILNARGVTTAFVRGLMTNPPLAIDGYMLGGDPEFIHRTTSSKYPVVHERDAVLAKVLKGHIVDPPEPKTIAELGTSWEEAGRDLDALNVVGDDYYADFLDFVESEARYYAENLPRLHHEKPTNFMFFYLCSMDKLQHFQLHEEGWSTIRKAYRILDDLLGELLEALQPENTLIHSDHGQEPFHMMFPDTPHEVQEEALGWRERAWRRDGRIFCQGATNAPLTAIHSLEGIHIFAGRDVAQGVRVDGRHIIDIHPTILRFFDIESDAEGVSMPIFRDASRNRDALPTPRFENIAVVQTLPVYQTLRVVNDLKIRYRGANLTVIGQERFRPTFLHDPRVTDFLALQSVDASRPANRDGSASALRAEHPEFDLIVVPMPPDSDVPDLWI